MPAPPRWAGGWGPAPPECQCTRERTGAMTPNMEKGRDREYPGLKHELPESSGVKGVREVQKNTSTQGQSRTPKAKPSWQRGQRGFGAITPA